MSDKLFNEVDVTLAGEVRVMRASFAAIRAIEVALGKPWSALGEMVSQGSYGISEMATIIYHGLKTGKNDSRLSYEQVGEAVVNAGLVKMRDPIILFISKGFEGTEAPKKAEAEATA